MGVSASKPKDEDAESDIQEVSSEASDSNTRPADMQEATGSSTAGQIACSSKASVPYANLGLGRMVRLHESGAEEYAEMKKPDNNSEPFLLYKFKDDKEWRRSDIPTLYGTFAAPAEALANPSAGSASALSPPAALPLMHKPAASDQALKRSAAAKKKPASAKQQKLNHCDIVDVATIRKCGPFKDKSYILDGNKGLVVNVSGKHAQHWQICCQVFDWLKANPGKTKQEAKQHKDALLAAQDVD
jgi:hypothetical protein